MTDADDADDLALLTNTRAQTESYCIAYCKQREALASMWTEYMCFKLKGVIYTLIKLKLVDKFTYLGSNISSTECDSIYV